jgi:hypothetical protein
MTPQDYELLLALRRQQADLQQSLEKLQVQLQGLEARVGPMPPELILPPIPVDLPDLPPIPQPAEEVVLPPIPTSEPVHVIDTLPPPPPPDRDRSPQPSLEFQFGRWLLRIGVVLVVISLAIIFAQPKVQAVLGSWGLLGLSAAISMGVVILGGRLERHGGGFFFFGRMVTALALAWLYLTLYTACFDEDNHLRVIHHPLLGGCILLLWSIYVLLLSVRKKSQTFAFFAVMLAYFSTALTPITSFTLGTDLLLAALAVLFLVRNDWSVLCYLSLFGTYLALLRRLVIDEDGYLVLDTSRTLSFWPHAIYLICAWLIFAAALILCGSPGFRGPKRLVFLSLNNFFLAGLLLFTAYIAGYGYSSMGWTLLDSGFALLLMSRFAGWAAIEPLEIMSAYTAQGLALVTAGAMIVYTGVTRAVLLTTETLLLGAAAAISADRVLIVTSSVTGFFAMLFLIWEIAVHGHHPWLLGYGGAAVMLLNAWWARGELRHSLRARLTVVPAASYYCALAVALIFTAMDTELSDNALPTCLALAALVLTFSIYFVGLFELPAVAQILLIIAQFLVVFPADTGEELPWWTSTVVFAATLLLVNWWSRQRVTRTGPWTVGLSYIYALALVGMTYHAMRSYSDVQGWMVTASLFSVIFLVYGAFTRVWSIAAAGQLFLAAALYHFFLPPDRSIFPWTWGPASVVLLVVFVTATATHRWLRLSPEIRSGWRTSLSLLAYAYQLLALVILVHWILGVVAPLSQIALFLFLGTIVLAANIIPQSSFGIRCSFLLSGLGVVLYLQNLPEHAPAVTTFFNGLAMVAFIIQPALLRLSGKQLITSLENWALLLFAAGTGWIFISFGVCTRLSAGYLTMSWALYALFLFLIGLLLWERRFRWCGLAVLLAAIIRVFCADFWGLSSGYRVLTFVLLTVITLGLGYIIARLADRPKSWL